LIKVFVVDDEIRQRNAIIKHTQWEKYNMAVTGEAESAQQALELAQAGPPDLLITDIRLIGTDGLELSERMRMLNKKLDIIMITGYEEFDYAKTAVGLGVSAFLIKPVDFVQFEKCLEQISNSQLAAIRRQEEETLMKEQLRDLMPIARERFLQELIKSRVNDEDILLTRARYLRMFESCDTYTVILMAADDMISPHTGEDALLIDQLKIKQISQGIFGALFEETTTTSYGETALIINGADFLKPTHELERKLEVLKCEIDIELKCNVSIGVGPAVNSLGGISESFVLARQAVNQRLLLGQGQIVYWRDIDNGGISQNTGVESLIKEFFEALPLGEINGSNRLLDEIVRCFIDYYNNEDTKLRSVCMELVSGACRVAGEMNESLQQRFGSEKELFERILDINDHLRLLQETIGIMKEFCVFFHDRKKNHYRLIIQSALEYINSHYSEDLSLNIVAEKVFLSASYLGAILRKELGQSFTEYLTSIRMKRAKELLGNPQLKLYEISESVGYQNPTYFNSLFKRNVGVIPTEYRNSLNIRTDGQNNANE